MTAAETAGITTRGRWAPIAPRPTRFVECSGSLGDLIHDVDFAGDEPARVMLVGPAPWQGVAGVRAWAAGPVPEGWEPDDAGHYYDGAQPVLRFAHQDGARLEVMRAATWFGDGDYSTSLAAEAWDVLGDRIAARFRGAALRSTPATTGRDTFLRSLGDHEYPVLSLDLQELIRSTSGQGRIELFAGAGELGRLVEYDGRLMYAGCVAELPTGPASFDHQGDYLGFTRARYEVTFTVPAGWEHVGLLGVHDGAGGWRWPREPGESGTTWADGVEVGIALRQGWHVRILSRLYWPERGRPLDLWASKLGACIDPEPAFDDLSRMVRAGVRSIVLHGIGAMHGRGYRVSRSSAVAELVPATAEHVEYDQGAGVYSWVEHQPARWPALSHPEWTAAIWARARARLLECPTGDRSAPAGLLHLDPRRIVATRTDAVYLTADPGWSDDGKVGRLTRRLNAPTSAPWPTSHRELLDLKARLEDGPDDPYSRGELVPKV